MRAICTIDGCESVVHGQGFCMKHYTRWQRYGDPLTLKHRAKGEGKATYLCLVCQSPFVTYRVYHEKNGVQRCPDCRQSSPTYQHKVTDYDCLVCGSRFRAKTVREKDGRNKYCSHHCYAVGLSRSGSFAGERNPRWKGGVTPLHRNRFTPAWKRIREQVMERDGHACTSCGMTRDESRERHGFDLCVHHIRRFLDGGDSSLANLKILCCHCHGKAEVKQERCSPS